MTFAEALARSREAFHRGFALDFGPPEGGNATKQPDDRDVRERASFELGLRMRLRMDAEAWR